jgi:ubiquitin-conjugating enzyme E2 D/E
MAKRLQKEFQMILDMKLDWATVELESGENLFLWKCTLKGPENSPYSAGTFHLKLAIPDTYPFKPPVAVFETPTYHPSISQKDKDKGSICPEILGKTWSPQLKINDVLQILRLMLAEPNVESPLEEEAAQLFVKDRAAYNKIAAEWTNKYARK